MHMDKDIERALSNSMHRRNQTGKKPGNLSTEQLKKLKEYKEYYEMLPSPRGGKNKLATVWNATMQLRRLGDYLNNKLGVKRYEDATKAHLLDYIKSMNSLSDKTTATAKLYIRMFYKWLYGIKKKYTYPDVVDDPRFIPNSVKNKKKPQDLLTTEEIKIILGCCQTYRGKSIIMLSVGEGGLRSGEIASLNISSVEFDEKGVKVWIEKSKSKERYVRLIKAEPYLREYINKEYQLDKSPDSKEPLFYAIAGPYYHKRLRGGAFNELLQRAAKRAGIKKRVYTHLGRAINISLLNKKGMSAEIAAKRFGITPTTLRNVYLTIDDKDADEAYCKVEGNLSDEEKLKIKKQDELLEPKICPRCKTKQPIDAKYCNCGMCLDPIEAATIHDRNSDVLKLMLTLMNKSPTLKAEAAKIVKEDEDIKALLKNLEKEYL